MNIKTTANKYQLVDNLSEDPLIEGQRYVLLSFISPELVQNCKIRALKVRGIFNTTEELLNHKNELEKKDKVHKIFYQEVGKWGIFKKEDEKILNELAGRRKEYLVNSKKTHKDRIKKSIKSGLEGKEYNIDDVIEENVIEEETKIINKTTSIDDTLKTQNLPLGPKKDESFELQDDTEMQTEKTNDDKTDKTSVGTLENDIPLSKQEYCLYSFLQPEGLMNTNIRSVKIRGVFHTLDDAKKKADQLRKIDKDYDIFIDETGKWMEQDPDPLSVPDAVYKNKKENQIMENLHKKCYDQKINGDEPGNENPVPTKEEQKEINKQLKQIPRKYIQQQKLKKILERRQEQKAKDMEQKVPEGIISKEIEENVANERSRINQKHAELNNLTERAKKINENLEKMKAAYKNKN